MTHILTKNKQNLDASLDCITIKGAKLHNLKDIDVKIPRNQLVVITGVSGSGKSTLAFDTLYAEGQRRYVESLSSYARQFLGRYQKPEVESIKGIAPAIAIEQKVISSNPRSTVGTTTEIYDYLKLLYARIGRTFTPDTNEEVKKDTVSDVIDYIKTFEERSKLLLLAPILNVSKKDWDTKVKVLIKQGYARIEQKGKVIRLQADAKIPYFKDSFLVIDRILVKSDTDFYNRLAVAIQEAFYEGHGKCIIKDLNLKTQHAFTNTFERNGKVFLEPSLHLFSFNNPYGACPDCEGFGEKLDIDASLVIPDTSKSVYEDAISVWSTGAMLSYKEKLINNAYKFDFPIHKPYFELTEKQQELLWKGNGFFTGLHDFFKHIEKKAYKISNRVLLSKYRGRTTCTTCKGKRLRKEATYVKINGKSLPDLVDVPISELISFFKNMELTTQEQEISKRILLEIHNRLDFLKEVGLSYLTLNRKSNTLSGGESQRINLATSLASNLVGSMYILDEPSIGLHARDNQKLIKILQRLRDLGNTVIVVEHDDQLMKVADHIIDIGPEAGYLGGQLVAQGNYKQLVKQDSLTAKYLSGRLKIPIPKRRPIAPFSLRLLGVRAHNLKNVDVCLPLQQLVAITGVSGSGKSTLVQKVLYPAVKKKLGIPGQKPLPYTRLEGDFECIQHIEYIDQHPIGRSSRSNSVTYIKAFDDIRMLFSRQNLAQLRKLKPGHFSFNTDGGRCDHCKGDGQVTIEMQFMPDVHLTCEHCGGKRFKDHILEVKFADHSIYDVLELTVDQAILFFNTNNCSRIAAKLQPLQDVGLGYVKLGQRCSTFSGGEAQRLKLSSFLLKGAERTKTLFIFDEPTTGLHFHDIQKLLGAFQALIAKGHSVVVIEHNLELVKCVDYILDLGPEGGEKGGQLVAEGTPEALSKNPKSFTGKYLKEYLS